MMQAMGEPGIGANSHAGYPVGTRNEFVAFYRVAIGPVYRSASRLVGGDRQRCDDLVQEAFLDLIREVRAGRITSVDIGWMIVAVRHRFIDSLRRREREERRLELVWTRQTAAADMSADTDSSEQLTLLLARVPDSQRAAVVLHHVDGLSVAEVAAALGKSTHATESLLARGRDQLRRLLTETSDD